MLGFRDVFPELVEKLNGHIRTGYFWREQPQLAEQSCLHTSTRWLFAANDDFFGSGGLVDFTTKKRRENLEIWSANMWMSKGVEVEPNSSLRFHIVQANGLMIWVDGWWLGDFETFWDILGHLGTSWDGVWRVAILLGVRKNNASPSSPAAARNSSFFLLLIRTCQNRKFIFDASETMFQLCRGKKRSYESYATCHD